MQPSSIAYDSRRRSTLAAFLNRGIPPLLPWWRHSYCLRRHSKLSAYLNRLRFEAAFHTCGLPQSGIPLIWRPLADCGPH